MSITPEQATTAISDKVVSLHASVAAIIAQIDTLQDDLIAQYNASHTEQFTFSGNEDTEETQAVVDLDCVKFDLADALKDITRAMEILGLV